MNVSSARSMVPSRQPSSLTPGQNTRAVVSLPSSARRSNAYAAVASVRARGGELVGEVENYEDIYRLCYVRVRRGSSSSWRRRSAEGSGAGCPGCEVGREGLEPSTLR